MADSWPLTTMPQRRPHDGLLKLVPMSSIAPCAAEARLSSAGRFRDEQGEYPPGTWLCNPRWRRHTPFTGSEGALIYVTVGHLSVRSLVPPIDG